MSGTKIAVVTDSSSDLAPDLADRYGSEVVPISIHFGTKSYSHGHDLTTVGFWDRFRRERNLPEVFAPSAESFAAAYHKYLPNQPQEILVLCGSGAARNATQAAEEIDLPVRVVDAGGVSVGLEMMVSAAAEAAHLGADSNDVLAAARRNRPELLAVASNFETMRRTGRVGLAPYAVARLFRLKPVVMVDGVSIEIVGQVLSRSRALTRLVEWLGDRRTASRVTIVHGNAPDIHLMVDRVRGQVPGVEPAVVLAGPALGIQLGAGFVALAASRA